jgi:hypothetical protein
MKPVKYLPIAFGLVIAVAALSPLTIKAQQGTATAPATAAATSASSVDVMITSPQIVSELHGIIPVRGTANMAGMRSYFLETRELGDDASAPSGSGGWTPATLSASAMVQNNILGSWDTTLIPDGLYELRLTVTTSSPAPTYFVVSPLRISNAEYLTMTPMPTQLASGTSNSAPHITAALTANVRSGDSTLFSVIGFLLRGSSVPILGISNSGWYYIQLADGSKGWVAPSVGVVTGDISTIPTMVATGSPASTAVSTGLLLNGIVLNPGAPVCGSAFTVSVNVNNPGNGTTSAGTVYIQDVDLTSKTVTATATGDVPALAPGANYVIVVPLTVMTYYNQQHQVQVTMAGSQITATYTLAQGQCNIGTIVPTITPANTSAPVVTMAPTVVPTVVPTAAPTTAATAVATKAA